jgi:hypothetical protein
MGFNHAAQTSLSLLATVGVYVNQRAIFQTVDDSRASMRR